MTTSFEEKITQYAQPEVLVSTDWVAQHLQDPNVRIAEADEDILLYEIGHIPGAVKLDWHSELRDPIERDFVDRAGFERLLSEKGIGNGTTVVLYGDKNNWWAAYALWVTKLFGHPDVRLMDGGRAKWIAEGRPLSTDTPKPAPVDYPVVERDESLIMVDDERMPLRPDEQPLMKKVRFRTLGCYPLTGAIESNADTLPAIIQEMLLTRTSERQGRVIDHDAAASMEKKKQEGYF